MDRHLTVSGFVVHNDRVALHWHRKNQMWLPAGGHIEPGEDPVEATLREIREEFAIEAEVVAPPPPTTFVGGPKQLPSPATILVCPIAPDHEHVDMVYFCRAVSGFPGKSYDDDNPIIWFDAADLELASAPVNGVDTAIPPDVVALGIEAIRVVGAAVAAGAR